MSIGSSTGVAPGRASVIEAVTTGAPGTRRSGRAACIHATFTLLCRVRRALTASGQLGKTKVTRFPFVGVLAYNLPTFRPPGGPSICRAVATGRRGPRKDIS